MINFFKKTKLSRKLKNLGVDQREYERLKRVNEKVLTKVKLLNKDILISNPYWYIHSLEEIFIDEIYTFQSNSISPYIVDCGANWGLSVIYFKMLYPQSIIKAYEADPNIFSLLETNIEKFNFNNVELFHKAVWKDDSLIEFSSDGALGGTVSSLGINDNNKVAVESVRLSEILDNANKVDLLKIDIEGAEYDVLEESKNKLGNVDRIFVEYHSSPNNDQTLHKILQILVDSGFRIYIKEAWENMKHPFNWNKHLYYDLQLNIFGVKNRLIEDK